MQRFVTTSEATSLLHWSKSTDTPARLQALGIEPVRVRGKRSLWDRSALEAIKPEHGGTPRPRRAARRKAAPPPSRWQRFVNLLHTPIF